MSKIEVNQISSQCGSTLTIGQSGDTVTLACGATQSGFGRTGTVDWDTTAKTTNFTAVSGTGYFINTTSGTITATLPASPSAGDIVSFADYTNTWGTNAVTVGRNSQPIGGVARDALLSVEGQSVTFVYVDGTEGWKNIQDSTSNITGNAYIEATGGTITTCGNYKIHTFTSPGTFCVSTNALCATYQKVDYLVVAGGGGGGGGSSGSGGGSGAGAGGFRESKCATTSGTWTASPLASSTSLPVSVTAYPITVGAGGTGGAATSTPPGNGVSGSNSIFSTITSSGGGGGRYGPCNSQAGAPGGSGGGASGGVPASQPGGSGNTPPVSPPQGNPGGNGVPFPQGPSAEYHSAGGGGAGGAGQPATPGSRAGGIGVSTSITGSPLTKSVGGTGGTYNCATTPISNEPANSGNGGWGKSTGPGGGPALAGANGGSGIVIIRYKYQ